MKEASLTIHVATDHAGFALKESIKKWRTDENFTVVDHGAKDNNPEDDFPDFISLAATEIAKDPLYARGIIFGGSGQGEAMMANRFKQVRATVYYGGNEEIISLSRQHNNANVLSIGARFVDESEAKKVIWDWLHTPTFEIEKYQRRNNKLDSLS